MHGQRDSHCPCSSAGKEDPVELDSGPTLRHDSRRCSTSGSSGDREIPSRLTSAHPLRGTKGVPRKGV